jgi:hypothetical protein
MRPTFRSDVARLRRALATVPGLTSSPVCPWCGQEVAPADYDRHLGTCKGET